MGSMAIAPCLFVKPVFYTWGPAGLLFLLTGSWLLFLAARALSRTLEVRADRIGYANEADPGSYARALARLHEDNLIPAVMPRKTTHPDLYDRLVNIGSPPDYVRPAKPSARSWQTFVLAVPLGILIAARAIPALSSAPAESDMEGSMPAGSEEISPSRDSPINAGPFELKSVGATSAVPPSTTSP
jgi:hypothetical protein